MPYDQGAKPYGHGTGTPHPVDIAIGRSIRNRRIICGISQETLAARCDITFQQIQKYEKGANRVAPSRLWKIAQALNVEVGHFFAEVTTPTEYEPKRERMLMELNRRFEQLPQAQQDAVYKLVTALTGHGGGL